MGDTVNYIQPPNDAAWLRPDPGNAAGPNQGNTGPDQAEKARKLASRGSWLRPLGGVALLFGGIFFMIGYTADPEAGPTCNSTKMERGDTCVEIKGESRTELSYDDVKAEQESDQSNMYWAAPLAVAGGGTLIYGFVLRVRYGKEA